MTRQGTNPELNDSRTSLENIRFDRRLANRRGWVDSASLGDYIKNLPDVGHKGELVAKEVEPGLPEIADLQPDAEIIAEDSPDDFR